MTADDVRTTKPPRKIRIKPEVKRTAKGIPDLNAVVGEKIYDIRKTLNLTQGKMAERVGLPIDTLGNLERGQSNITLASLAELAVAYNVDPITLIGGSTDGVGAGGCLTLDTLARLTRAIDTRVQDLLLGHGPVAIGQAHIASMLGALFDAISNTQTLLTSTEQPAE